MCRLKARESVITIAGETSLETDDDGGSAACITAGEQAYVSFEFTAYVSTESYFAGPIVFPGLRPSLLHSTQCGPHRLARYFLVHVKAPY
ncbi:MAG: hypothetical protein ACI9SK_000835 [Zhongshania sp.]|jgi:hypothetical protein